SVVGARRYCESAWIRSLSSGLRSRMLKGPDSIGTLAADCLCASLIVSSVSCGNRSGRDSWASAGTAARSAASRKAMRIDLFRGGLGRLAPRWQLPQAGEHQHACEEHQAYADKGIVQPRDERQRPNDEGIRQIADIAHRVARTDCARSDLGRCASND